MARSHAVEDAPKPPVAPWEQDLLDHVRAHVDAERELLEAYEELATGDGYVPYLIRLIIADERSHHRLFEEIANALRSELEWQEITPRTPGIRQNAKSQTLAEQTERLLAFERQDAKDLRGLRKELRQLDGTLFPLLVEIMERDNEKHVRILEFLHAVARR